MLANHPIAPIAPEIWQVISTCRETADTFTLTLEPPAARDGLAFRAGQFNMLYVFGVGEVPISISGDPARPDKLVHTTRAVGAVSRGITALQKGAMLGVRGPFGSAWPVEEAVGKDVILVAGGIGLAPLRPAIYQILSNRRRYGRVSIYYGARTPEDLLFLREIEEWRGRLDALVDVTVDSAKDDWRGNVGVVTTRLRRAEVDPVDSLAMICGPEIMMRYAIAELRNLGLSEASIFLSMERNMQCGLGHCGHCQYGPEFICKDGPVFVLPRVKGLFKIPEV